MQETKVLEASVSEACKPLLKWPGGKRWILPQIRSVIPKTFGQYVEPFAGGAALFFGLAPTKALIADVNAELIQTYKVVANEPDLLIQKLSEFENSEASYYRIRASVPETELEIAARFMFLMTTCFNGIYRVNLKGKFNVPYGYKTHKMVCDADHLLQCSKVLSRAEFRVADFRDTITEAGDGDLVYIDPPYTVAHNQNGFIKYNEQIFSWRDQVELAEVATECSKRGATVIVSNADHPSVQSLYPGFRYQVVSRYSSVSGIGAGRKQVSEAVFIGEK